MDATQHSIIEQFLQPLTEALTPDSAAKLSKLKAPSHIQAIVDDLAAKCNEGELTDEERTAYESYVQIGNIFSLLKAKAKKIVESAS